MSSFERKTVAILGRQPELGLAELESLYGSEHLKPIAGAALLDIDAFDINFKRLGGTVKVARVLNILPTTKWQALEKYLIENVPPHMQYVPEGKFTLGLSVYGLDAPVEKINKAALRIKKVVKASGRSMRVVPNKTPELNSAQVLHNKLTSLGAWELLLIRNGDETILAQSIFVQDIEAYAARDQARPKRDARVGMLPPKLAQIMINLANPAEGGLILDPFSGTGVVLQEALLMGYKVAGSDIDPRMVSFAKANIDWLSREKPALAGKSEFEVADATSNKWVLDVDAVVSELYLGRPMKALPPDEEFKQLVADMDTLVKKFLKNMAGQLKKDTPVSIAVPSWRKNGSFVHLPTLEKLSSLGYTQLDFKHVKRQRLLYFREDQIVARQLIVIRKS